MSRKTLWLSLIAICAIVVGLVVVRPSTAQGPQQIGIGPLVFAECSTTDYIDVMAQALGMTSTELRVALVSGKTLNDIATSKNVTLQTVTDAIAKARKADIDQAIKDGLLTQQEADKLNSVMNGIRPNTGNDQGRLPAVPGFGILPRGMFGFGDPLGANPYHTVKTLPVAAKAIGISCADLVKALGQGQPIAQVAASKNIQAQAVIDAIVAAHKDALAQDVKDGLRTQAQADGESSRLTQNVTNMVYQSRAGLRGAFGLLGSLGQRGGFGLFGNRGQQGGFGLFSRLWQFFSGQGRRFPGGGQPQQQPTPTATPKL